MDDIGFDFQFCAVVGMACVFAALALDCFIRDCKIARDANKILDQIDKENQEL